MRVDRADCTRMCNGSRAVEDRAEPRTLGESQDAPSLSQAASYIPCSVNNERRWSSVSFQALSPR